jgi:hypothetical protein
MLTVENVKTKSSDPLPRSPLAIKRVKPVTRIRSLNGWGGAYRVEHNAYSNIRKHNNVFWFSGIISEILRMKYLNLKIP